MKAKLFTLGLAAAITAPSFATPAQAAPLPVLTPPCDTKIEQSFQMGGDRTCTGNGWHINKAGITIDMAGHTLRGDRTGGDTGLLFEEAITTDPADGVTIRNGAVRGFSVGVNIGSSITETKLESVAAVDNLETGFHVGGKRITLKSVSSIANDEDGIVVDGGATKVAITNSRVANNGELGIFFISDGNLVKKSAVIGNGESGILVNGDKNRVLSNTVAGNGNSGSAEPGIYALFGDRNVFTKNVIFGNGDDGYRDAATKNEASKNVAFANGFYQGNGSGGGTGIDVGTAVGPKGSGNLSLGNDATLQCNKASMCKKVKGDKDLPKLTPQCGSTVLKSFRLGGDMNCPGDGLIVGASDVTIDLAGHTIRGDGGAGDRGIYNGTGDAVRIVNGVIRRFDVGVRLNAIAANAVKNVISVDNTGAGFSASGTGHTFRKSTSVANGVGGFSIFSTATTVDASRSSNNTTSGIFVGGLAGAAEITRNVVAGNTGTGISISVNANASELHQNVVGGNGIADGYGGIESSALGTVVERNDVFGNGGAGYADFGATPKVNLNRFNGNGYVLGSSNDSGLGIDASVAFYEGAGNIALGNDHPDECDPESLCA